MQIDFHHSVTYVVSRLAGMTHDEANTIAYSAQYVDDATNHGAIRFTNGATYSRVATAHKMLDYTNFSTLANHHAWVPFHFLPGNDNKKAGANHDRRFIYKMVCRPGSFVAADMVRDCILEHHRPYALHRLGITMHVYIDTFAHYGFCGVSHTINRAKEIHLIKGENNQPDTSIGGRLKSFFGNIFDDTASDFVSNVQPLGHGAVLSYPDQPYLRWKYINGLGDIVERHNPDDYMLAVKGMYQAVYRFREGNPDAVVPHMQDSDWNLIKEFIHDLIEEDGDKRHQQWLQTIKEGRFSFGPEELGYIPKGVGSWKHAALGTHKAKDHKDDVFDYTPDFLSSNWKMFHDAALAHQFNVLHNILPRYGICVG